MGYQLLEVELSRPLEPVRLAPDQGGCGIIARWQGRLAGFQMIQLPLGATLSSAQLRDLADREFAAKVLELRLEAALPEPQPPAERPSLSIAICTRNRAARLGRLLHSLQVADPDPSFRSVEVVVVDNGSSDDTRGTVASFADARYVHEPRAGLNFGRNAALRTATGDLLAYLDDDVVVDRKWLGGLARAWRSRPDAGGFTGLALPYRLSTEAQVLFEQRGGFGRGFSRIEFRSESYANPLFPVGAGSVGAGCNMAFDRQLLLDLGGFDEALDTGAPLPGGGDLDIFYRVLRSGRPMIYEPDYAVYHEHREGMAELKRQYWSWGLGLMAFLAKSGRTDRALAQRHRAMVRWWFADQLRSLLRALRRGDLTAASFGLAELRGGLMGVWGEYDRSQARVAAIRASAA
ncbi:glycosyltransferase [Sphingomonas sp. BN140010]|uniref:Glycosyltransferase n=1 Tax=Sphingomonas arvum TaxID=2992113 RepID=A0ABT3JF17_9SPHN|nr:glycosyltransferase [Sphingomonas sp. BN140010]MCW3797365.1 glycosyltransferase [Sphingomonas sp. BN140010]